MNPLDRERRVVISGEGEALRFSPDGLRDAPVFEAFLEFYPADHVAEYLAATDAIDDRMRDSSEWILLRRELGGFEILFAYRSRDGAWRSVFVQDTPQGLEYRADRPMSVESAFEADIRALGSADLIREIGPRSLHGPLAPYMITIRRNGSTARVALLNVGDDAIDGSDQRWQLRWNIQQEDLEVIETVRRVRAAILAPGATGED